MFVVPTVDLSPYLDGDPGGRPRTAVALDAACRALGFMQVVGHGIRNRAVTALTEAVDAFFALPDDDKRALVVTDGTNRGYSPPRSESLSRSLGVEQGTRMNDFFEAFNVGTAADGPSSGGDGNVWPDLPGFREGVETWVGEARRVARALTTAMGDALGDRDVFRRLATDPVEVLRMNHYALEEQDLPVDADLTGMGEHTDYGIVTVLWADAVAGLQVLDGGEWHDVVPDDGALLVNLGDLTARVTGDHWRSTLHRVRPPVEDGRVRRRRSAAFFHDGDPDAVVETLPLPGAVPYAATTVRDHLAAKLAGSRDGKLNLDAGREESRVRAVR
ncbi:isopenicillin N synthase family dioxygenase [Actinomycetospora termitidis]|uniref:2-oxoglutarate and iron-dependent oxygenase domain-containing protein n=1 Tax=Actinomycetospora termitidis TaxID=3053470 RepID=A0ABT7M530_9PSEU|nr:2-oxoglutarate and iron-dependent oxygenase domain-containing protein [Actinomycetospora sp. Odt1-22]MDL5155561.1 2-oxoglutarate and iron-dependent oxygenase domain-containing protein [Actinomycetospora sp. Odt1-22]